MMAFSESFGLGNSTFMNLESEVNKVLQVNSNKPQNVKAIPSTRSNPMDIIDESPTNSKGKQNKSRSRHYVSQLGGHRRKHFRRSKSDSTLGDKTSNATRAAVSRAENYSEFFNSEFSIELEPSKAGKPVSFVSTTQIEAAFERDDEDKAIGGDEIAFEESKMFSEMIGDIRKELSKQGDRRDSSNELDAPVFSEDLREILNDSSPEKEVSFTEVGLTSEDWKESLKLSEFQESPENVNDGSRSFDEAEDFVNIDDGTFICPDDDGREFADKTLNEIKSEVSMVLQEDPGHTSMVHKSKALPELEPEPPKEEPTPEVPEVRSDEPYVVKRDLEELKRISAWNLPQIVVKEYQNKGINKMFDWQIECLSNPAVLFEHRNLVYSAPTSAGKTLVSEILLIKTILERGKKVIMILPFISVVREKMFYLQDLLISSGYRVEGFFGGYTPPGGFDSINVAICTIEKANSIINKLLEQGKLDNIGTVVVDEIHLISDPGRGYILELLLAKVLYMSMKYAMQIQIITMSATLANVELLKNWLKAELYITNYRPVALQEMIKVGTKIFDSSLKFLRDIDTSDFGGINDPDHVALLCIETLVEGCSVVVFCPSKDWCENLSVQLAAAIHSIGKSGSEIGNKLRAQIKRDAIEDVKKQLRDIPTGLDSVLEKTITFACAFHHAGLTTEERDIIEACFKSGALKVIVATSTLSSGVNLPARRVIIRSPLFGGKQMSSLTYKQMIGRAGRTGKDTVGESILICTESNARVGKDLVGAKLKPISSCLDMENSTHLKRALLEVISSGVATTKSDVENFVKCTLLNTQKEMSKKESDDGEEERQSESLAFISESIEFLLEYEFIRLQNDEESGEVNYVATRLGMACLASSMPPTDGLILFSELQKSRRCFVLESELHAVYLVTPYSVCYQLNDLDWLMYLDLWEKLPPSMKKVGELVGVKESFLVRAMRGQVKLDYKLMQIHKRFYTALALQELVNETPVNTVAAKYKCTRGMLQSLQQMASTFAGIVTAFCNSLNWTMLSLIVGEFKERLFFGVHRDLIDLMRLPDLNYKRARALFDAGIQNLIDLANSDVFTVEKILHNSLSFDTAKKLDNEDEYEANQRNNMRNLFITGKVGLTVKEAAKMLVNDARQFVQYEIGVGNINWSQEDRRSESGADRSQLQVSSEVGNSKRKSCSDLSEASPPKIAKVVAGWVGRLEMGAKSWPERGESVAEGMKASSSRNENQYRPEARREDDNQRNKNVTPMEVSEKITPTVRRNDNKSNVRGSAQQNGSPLPKVVEIRKEPQDRRAASAPKPVNSTAKSEDVTPKASTAKRNDNKSDIRVSAQQKESPLPRVAEKRTTPLAPKPVISKAEAPRSEDVVPMEVSEKITPAVKQSDNKSDIRGSAQKKESPLPRVVELRKDSQDGRVPKPVNSKPDTPKSKDPSLNARKYASPWDNPGESGKNVNDQRKPAETHSKPSSCLPRQQGNRFASKVSTPNATENRKPLNSDQAKGSSKSEAKPLAKEQVQDNRVENNQRPMKETRPRSKPDACRSSEATAKPAEAEKQAKPYQKCGNPAEPAKPHQKFDKPATVPQQKCSPQISNRPPPLRRSPRNHLPSSTRIEQPSNSSKPPHVSAANDDLFTDDSSFEMNSEIANAMDNENVDPKHPEPPRKSLNKSSDEIAASQEMTFQPKTQSTRFLRSYNTQTSTRASPKHVRTTKKPVTPSPPPSPVPPEVSSKSASIEISDFSLGNSILQNPIQLNSSHILSSSKAEPDAISLNCINIVDICGSQMLFKSAMKELLASEKLGFAVAVEKHASKRKPLIGANLLINQLAADDQEKEPEVDFAINDSSYVAGVAMVMSENNAFYLNLQSENTAKGLTRQMKVDAIRRVLSSELMTLQIFDSKEQLKILRRVMPEIDGVQCKVEDPRVANWLLQPDNSLNLTNMAQQFAPECKALVKLSGSGQSHGSIATDSSSPIFGKIRSSIEACATMYIIQGQTENLERIGKGQLQKFFLDVEMPVQLSLCNMEIYGFPANENSLRSLYQKMVDTMKKLETKIYEAHGSRFNLGSSSAVGRVLGLHRKPNGRVSTSRQILEKIDSPIAQMIISYRKLSFTSLSTIQPLMHCVVNDRIHGQSITLTSTGRISMHEPNLQNVAKDFEIPIGTSDKVNISCRSSFFPPKGRCLVSADFCQLEMRILAHLSQDQQLVQVMNSKKDVFTAIAAKWNKMPEDSISEELRNGTKQICYGIVYGMGMKSLAESLKCSEQEAMTVSEQFHAAYPGIRLYAGKVVKFARQHGYIETITGRRRYLEHINAAEQQLKSQAERQAVNSAIQGSAADIAKTAILRMEKNIDKYREKMGLTPNCVHLVLHLHDELIFEVPEDKAKKVAKVLSITMENCVRLSVPLKVKLKIGKSWGTLEEVRL